MLHLPQEFRQGSVQDGKERQWSDAVVACSSPWLIWRDALKPKLVIFEAW